MSLPAGLIVAVLLLAFVGFLMYRDAKRGRATTDHLREGAPR